ncbi:MAG: flagellar M-ring protein FliF [Gammaproteobacteria bacterium TMED92]|nr:MAG: flagellar M-ring protein FliF [Gammaproteobacteria bacterium TMED92]
MAESALEPSNQALAPATAGRVAAPNAAPAPATTPSEPIIRSILNQPGVQRTLPAIVVLFSLAALAFIYTYVSAPVGRPLFSELSDADRQVAYDALLAGGEYGAYLDTNTGLLMVPEDKYFSAKLFLASQNIPRSASTAGFESLLENSSMTTSRNMEMGLMRTQLQRDLEQTIGQIGSVRKARVHIAEPQQSPFIKNRAPAKASVYIEPYSGRQLTQTNIQAIVHLVSSSIPYLPAENVTVIDNRGALLSGPRDQDNAMSLTTSQTEHELSIEDTYRSRIDQLLGAIVGYDNVNAQVDVMLNFTAVETTYEDFDRDNTGGKTRSESVSQDEQQSKSGQGPDAGTFVETPAATEVSENSTQTSTSTTRNYELDREIRYVKQQVGTIDRITVSVIIDPKAILGGEADADPNGQLSPERVAEFEDLIKGVIGFDEQRGDSVKVVPTTFNNRYEDFEEPPKSTFEMIQGYVQDPTIKYLSQTLIAVFLVLLTLFTVVRPAVKYYTAGRSAAGANRSADGELSAADVERIRQGDNGNLEEIKTKLMPKRSSIPEDMLNTANTYEDKIAVMRMMVADDPGRVANLLKRMINS